MTDVPLIDTGNPLLARMPCNLTTGTIEAKGQTFGVVTVRTGSTTLSVLLTKDELSRWVQLITSLRDGLSTTGLITGQSPNGGVSRTDL